MFRSLRNHAFLIFLSSHTSAGYDHRGFVSGALNSLLIQFNHSSSQGGVSWYVLEIFRFSRETDNATRTPATCYEFSCASWHIICDDEVLFEFFATTWTCVLCSKEECASNPVRLAVLLRLSSSQFLCVCEPRLLSAWRKTSILRQNFLTGG